MHTIPIYFDAIKKTYPDARLEAEKVPHIEVNLGTFTLDIRDLKLSTEPSADLHVQYFMPLTHLKTSYKLQETHLQLCNLINIYLPFGAVGVDYNNKLLYWKYSETITGKMTLDIQAEKNKIMLNFISTILATSRYSFNAILQEGFTLKDGLKGSSWEHLL